MHSSIEKLLTSRTLFVSLLAASLPVAVVHASPAEQGRSPMNTMIESLASRLAEVGRHFGDSSGFIGIQITDTNETLYLATSERESPFRFYVIGQDVTDEATLAACSVDQSGEVDRCDEAYGETLLFALEDAQEEEGDPTEFTIACHPSIGGGNYCKVTWLAGGESCYLCNPTCRRVDC